MLNLKDLHDIPDQQIILPPDENGRSVKSFHLAECSLTSSLFYPNPVVYSHIYKTFFRPIKEEAQSLKKAKVSGLPELSIPAYSKIYNDPVFFFIYNTDNYFHFIYDTLPYLIQFLDLRRTMPIKLLMSLPNPQAKSFYPFVLEFLSMLNISKDDIVMADADTLYHHLFISTSYTQDFNPNLPPRQEVYDFFRGISSKVIAPYGIPEKIYISRRTWLHNDFSNIGTNYTQRRKLENEDELVSYLESKGYTEVFAEKLSTIQKLAYFIRAKDIVGAFGGGIANALFSKPSCNLIGICSPGFLDVNFRFHYALSGVKLNVFRDTYHVDPGPIRRYTRVQYGSIIGEVERILPDGDIEISYLQDNLAGWNSEMSYQKISAPQKECVALDNGLNSPWKIDMERFKELL